jgi:hypothetical protein
MLLLGVLAQSLRAGTPAVLWRTVIGEATRTRSAQALYPAVGGGVWALVGHELIELDPRGRIRRRLALAPAGSTEVASARDGGSLYVAYCGRDWRAPLILRRVDLASGRVLARRVLPLNRCEAALAAAPDGVYLAGATEEAPGSPQLVLLRLDRRLATRARRDAAAIATPWPLEAPAGLIRDRAGRLLLLAWSRPEDPGRPRGPGWADALVRLDADLKVLWQRQRLRRPWEDNATGPRYLGAADAGSHYLVLAGAGTRDGGIQQVLFRIGHDGRYLGRVRFPRSGRYGHGPSPAGPGRWTLAAESADGKAWFAEVDARGRPLYQRVYRDERGWSPATAALHGPEGWWLAVEAAADAGQQARQLRSAILLRFPPSPANTGRVGRDHSFGPRASRKPGMDTTRSCK